MGNSPTLSACKTQDSGPLDDRSQMRNVVLVGINTGLSYLASPVLYVGVVHAALGEQLGASATVSNLPASAYLVLCVLPLIVAWLFPRPPQLKPILVTSYAAVAVVNALVTAVLIWSAPPWLRIAVLILQGGVVGGARTVAVACEFEVLGRAVSPTRRGAALGLAYGLGPIFAIAGALVSQLLLSGRVAGLSVNLVFPANFAALFGATVPILTLGAFLSSQYVMPRSDADSAPVSTGAGPFSGLGEFLGRRVVRRAMIAAVAAMAGYQIISNMTLYTRVILEDAPAQFAGYQNMMRFACKAVSGIFLGWLLARTTPRAGLFVSASFGLSAVLWATVAPGKWFLASFGLLGAGELFGIYFTNYVLCTAPPTQMRRYMAFTMLALFSAAPANVLYGVISDCFPEAPAEGFRLSFLAATLMIGCGIALMLLLPGRPRPDDEPALRSIPVDDTEPIEQEIPTRSAP
jgi:hypothetical protein